jgi:regulator of replication initiation timing
MAHLTDKMLGLKKLQKELQLIQEELAKTQERVSNLLIINDELNLEIKRLNQILSRKGKAKNKTSARTYLDPIYGQITATQTDLEIQAVVPADIPSKDDFKENK